MFEVLSAAWRRWSRRSYPAAPEREQVPRSEGERVWRQHLDLVDERTRRLDAAVARTTGGVKVPSYYVPSAEGAAMFPGVGANGNGSSDNGDRADRSDDDRPGRDQRRREPHPEAASSQLEDDVANSE